MARAAYIENIEREIRESIGKLRRFQGDYFVNEEQTRYALIDPVLRTLGWDPGNPEQVKVEHNRLEGNRTDYEFFLSDSNTPIMVVEAKRIYQNTIKYVLGEIEDPPEYEGTGWVEWEKEDIDQLSRYVVDLQKGYAVLTDGIVWCIWDLSEGNVLGPKTCAYHEWSLDINTTHVADVLKILHRRNVQRKFS